MMWMLSASSRCRCVSLTRSITQALPGSRAPRASRARAAPTPPASAPSCRGAAPGRPAPRTGRETPVNSGISPARAFAYRPFTSRRSHSSTGVATWTSTNAPYSSTSARAFRRASSYGEMADTTTAAPCRASRDATQPIRSSSRRGPPSRSRAPATGAYARRRRRASRRAARAAPAPARRARRSSSCPTRQAREPER